MVGLHDYLLQLDIIGISLRPVLSRAQVAPMDRQWWKLIFPHLLSQSVLSSTLVDLLIGLHDLPYDPLEAGLVVHHRCDEFEQGLCLCFAQLQPRHRCA